MEFLKWEEKYSVGVSVIDEQHQQLFRLLNTFIGNFGKASREEIQATLDAMVEYIDYHFQSEEPHYRKHPDFAVHQREHAIFIKKTRDFQKAMQEHKEDLSLAVLNFLLSWLKNHILTTDLKFFSDMRAMNV